MTGAEWQPAWGAIGYLAVWLIVSAIFTLLYDWFRKRR
jgi:hypothetical protein